eukprot:14684155-Alexandrium_andersonii.AAC.1
MLSGDRVALGQSIVAGVLVAQAVTVEVAQPVRHKPRSVSGRVTQLGPKLLHPGGPLLPAEVGAPGCLHPVVEQIGPT